MPSLTTSLPVAWVNRIFDKLTMVYGQPFLRRWADLDLDAVKSDWAHELAGFKDHPEAISYALQHLGVNPPTVLEFRAMARAAPAKVVPLLEAPKADPAIVAAVVAGLNPNIREPKGDDGKDWARRHMARHEAGEWVRPITLGMAREALGMKP